MKRNHKITNVQTIMLGLVANAASSAAVALGNSNSGIVSAIGEDTYTITVTHSATTGGSYTTAKDRHGDNIVFTLGGAASESFDLKVASLKPFLKLLATGTNGIDLVISLGDKDYAPTELELAN